MKISNYFFSEEKSEKKKELVLCFLSGVLLGISFPPFPFPVLIFFSLIPYLIVIEKKDNLSSISRFTYFTIFFFTIITLYWVGSWTKEADPFLMISGALLMFVNPAIFLIPSTLYYFCKRIFNKNIALFLLPFFWVAFEYAYSLTDLRFPWLTLANSLSYFNWYIQIADIIGAYGISLLILYINIFLYKFLSEYYRGQKKLVYLLVAVLLFIFPVIYGIYKTFTYEHSQKRIKVGLVQPNLNPWDKWEAKNLDELLNVYLELSQNAVNDRAKLIVWPESALPVYLLSGNYDGEVDRIHKFVDSNNVFLMTGMPDATFYFDLSQVPPDAKKIKNSDVAYTSYNSILLFSPFSNRVQKYAKIKLVPFGEKVPFVEQLPFLGDLIKWQVGISSWNVGKEQILFDLLNFKAAGVICFESIYPDFVANFVKNGAQLLVVVTNDSWYGYSSGPFQHKEFAALRAVENRRTIVRAANGGISCIIDPLGRTIIQTNLFTKNVLVGYAELRNEITFFSKYPLIVPILTSFVSLMVLILYPYKNLLKRRI
ncbi:MAG: apolipoprotein N-acyltransferase [Melioribacter sp.]|nr:apolipoprotein N-acyltransferase [Melioribacter sp.]